MDDIREEDCHIGVCFAKRSQEQDGESAMHRNRFDTGSSAKTYGSTFWPALSLSATFLGKTLYNISPVATCVLTRAVSSITGSASAGAMSRNRTMSTRTHLQMRTKAIRLRKTKLTKRPSRKSGFWPRLDLDFAPTKLHHKRLFYNESVVVR